MWLEDISRAIAEIAAFVPESVSFSLFQQDIKTKRAVERNIEIIGEAMRRILSLDPNIKISNTRKIVDTRNRIIHGYDSVSDEITWTIVRKYLPILSKEIKELKDKS